MGDNYFMKTCMGSSSFYQTQVFIACWWHERPSCDILKILAVFKKFLRRFKVCFKRSLLCSRCVLPVWLEYGLEGSPSTNLLKVKSTFTPYYYSFCRSICNYYRVLTRRVMLSTDHHISQLTMVSELNRTTMVVEEPDLKEITERKFREFADLLENPNLDFVPKEKYLAFW